MFLQPEEYAISDKDLMNKELGVSIEVLGRYYFWDTDVINKHAKCREN